MTANIERHLLRHRVVPMEVFACGEGEPLVLLHGWGLAGNAYKGAMQSLAAQGWRVVAPTIRLHTEWSLKGAAEMCAEAMAGLDVVGAPVIGHSYGGIVATATAIEHPNFVESLIAVSTPLVPLQNEGLKRFLSPGRQYRLAGHAAAARAMARSALSVRGISNLTTIARWFLRDDHGELRESLAGLELPRALVWVENDSLFPAQVGLDSHAAFGGTYMTVDNTDGNHIDHDWPMRQPKHFSQTVGGLVRVLRANQEPQARDA